MWNFNKKLMVVGMLTALTLTACVSTGNISMKEQSQQSIDSKIIKGKTTKQEIANLFGHADAVTFTDSGKELWTYAYSRSKPKARNFIPYNFFSLGDNVQTKELVVLFDTQGVVSNYTFRETANQTRYGIVE
ncbi:outer membrane protein assembly factor BamE [Moraxella nasovis]|uniref:outer membrane protein assembly factor BamE n=1 Tax=Moraxella nasovis TaxID=2904121 RepID=UPI001F60950B|nr:outer membrane protein assembly factor BamE [Moraxella nasovis]UNU72707.1 outer membrane protein assembly factor BamE [Moraxella nasovis]